MFRHDESDCVCNVLAISIVPWSLEKENFAEIFFSKKSRENLLNITTFDNHNVRVELLDYVFND
jgi:hypothetical protein